MTAAHTAKAILAESLGLADTDIDGSVGLSTTDAWDSLAHFRLVLAIEAYLGRTLTPVETISVTDFAQVLELVSNK